MSSTAVSIVDYGVGNLGSVRNMLRRIGVEHELVTEPEHVDAARRLLLPGVGAFDHGMAGLRSTGLAESVMNAADRGVPILGVCLGLQLLSRGSEEGTSPGLGLLPGACVRFRPDDARLRVPHMGWNWVDMERPHPIVDQVPVPAKFYFAHSYHLVLDEEDALLATSTYGNSFVSMAISGSVVGAQFHPEKSHVFGMALLSAFAGWQP